MGKNSLGGAPCEGLESALGIEVGKAENDAQGQIENTPEELPMQRLALGLEFGTQPARANGDVSSGLKGGKKFVRLLDGRGEVGIGEEQDLA